MATVQDVCCLGPGGLEYFKTVCIFFVCSPGMPTFHYKANLMINDYFIIRERKYFGNWQISHILRRARPFMVKIIEKTQREPTSARQAIIILMGLVSHLKNKLSKDII